MLDWIGPAMVIAAKDLRLEMRTKSILSSVGLFALLVVVVASFSFPATGAGKNGVAAGLLWMSFLFSSLLGMGRSFSLEDEEACIEGLMASPAPRESIYLGKLLANLLFIGAVEAVVLPAFLILFQLEPGRGIPLLALTAFLGTLGIVALGTLFSAMAVKTRTREAILPLLVMPLCVPIVIAAVKATETALGGAALSASASWLYLLAGFDALLVTVGLAAFPYVLDE
ncbi:MAG: heme exporter protein CcmB [Actinomycetota bacterium]